jgi:hypothetical protein
LTSRKSVLPFKRNAIDDQEPHVHEEEEEGMTRFIVFLNVVQNKIK